MTAKRGVLVRAIPVRLLNVSSSGFLLESRRAIDVRTGILDVAVGGTRYLRQANLRRSVHVPGAGDTFHLGGTFSAPVADAHRDARIPDRRLEHRPARPRAARAPQTSAA